MSVLTGSGRRVAVEGLQRRIGSVYTLIALLLLCAVFTVQSPPFLSSRNLVNILMHTSVIGIVSVGMTFVILTGGIDLSVGSTLALSAVVAAQLVKMGVPWLVSLPTGLAVGVVIGIANGLLVTRGKLPPFIVTLGMMGIARGLALIFSGGRAVYGLPAEVRWVGQGYISGLPLPVVLLLLTVLIAHWVLFHTRFGLHTKVIGDNETAARVTGIQVARQLVAVYVLSGLLAAVGGLLFMGRVNAAEPLAGSGYELDAVAAVIIGGTSLFGGSGTVIGTLIGALTVGVLRNGLNLLAVSPYYQEVAIGAIIIAAVLFDRLRAVRA